jgi:ribosomal protein S27AE
VDFLYTGDFIISTGEEVGPVESSGGDEGDGSSTATETKQDGEQQDLASEASKALVTAVKVYIIADKYDIPPLKLLSATKYRALLPLHWNSNSFTESLQIIFNGTTENDRLLKDVAVNFAGRKSKELMDRGEFVSLLKGDGEMAVEILKASLPKVSTDMAEQLNPLCVECGKSDSVVLARNKSKPGLWWCYRCKLRFS